jgi:hypothetical protein
MAEANHPTPITIGKLIAQFRGGSLPHGVAVPEPANNANHCTDLMRERHRCHSAGTAVDEERCSGSEFVGQLQCKSAGHNGDQRQFKPLPIDESLASEPNGN